MPGLNHDWFNPDKWGLPAQAVQRLGDDLRRFWKRFRVRFRTRTRDTSEQAYCYWRGQLTMEDARNDTNIERRLALGDGQKLQQFVTDSPWSKRSATRFKMRLVSSQLCCPGVC